MIKLETVPNRSSSAHSCKVLALRQSISNRGAGGFVGLDGSTRSSKCPVSAVRDASTWRVVMSTTADTSGSATIAARAMTGAAAAVAAQKSLWKATVEVSPLPECGRRGGWAVAIRDAILAARRTGASIAKRYTRRSLRASRRIKNAFSEEPSR